MSSVAGVGRINLNIEGITEAEILRYQEIITVLISSGAFGLKNGQAVLYFDADNVFQGVKLEYWAFKRKKESPPQ